MSTEAQWLVVSGMVYIVGVFTGFMVKDMIEMRASRQAMQQLLKRGQRDLEQAHALLTDLRNGHG